MTARTDPPREGLSMGDAALGHVGRVADIRIMTFVPLGVLGDLDQPLSERLDSTGRRSEIQAAADDDFWDLGGLDHSPALPRLERREIARGLYDFVGRRRAGNVRHARGRHRVDLRAV